MLRAQVEGRWGGVGRSAVVVVERSTGVKGEQQQSVTSGDSKTKGKDSRARLVWV